MVTLQNVVLLLYITLQNTVLYFPGLFFTTIYKQIGSSGIFCTVSVVLSQEIDTFTVL